MGERGIGRLDERRGRAVVHPHHEYVAAGAADIAPVEVDRARVGLVDELRPRRTRIRRLAEREIESGRRILDGLEGVDPQRLRRVADDCRGVLRRRSRRRQSHERDQTESRTTVADHPSPPFKRGL